LRAFNEISTCKPSHCFYDGKCIALLGFLSRELDPAYTRSSWRWNMDSKFKDFSL